MDTDTITDAPAANAFKEWLSSGALYRHATAILALAGVATLGIAMIMWASKPGMTPVYDRINKQDTLSIVETLRAENIPYEIEPKTGLVLIPTDKISEIRMKLAANGLVESDNQGIEMLREEQGFGTSQFIEKARYQHAQETELSRTISSMRNIHTARVHLAMPKQSVFIRNRAKPSASIMVKMNPGRTLEDNQVNAIVHLVASSIPYMESSQVTVVDQWGRLLSNGGKSTGMDATRQQFEYTRQLEKMYAQRIEELLTPLLGSSRIHAKVNADIDFTYNERTQELFDPDNTQVRSEQTQAQKSSGGTLAAIGVPGALSNQPPGAGTTNARTNADKNGNKVPTNESSQATRNYELDKTISHSRNAQGKLQRLSVAVIIDNETTVNEEGETTSTPLPQEQIDTLTKIVQGAIGFNINRGDSVAVFNQSFQPQQEIEPIEDLPLLEQPWIWELSKQVLIGLAFLLLVLFVARPAMKSLAPPKQLTKDADDEKDENDIENALLADEEVSLSTIPPNDPNALPAPFEAYGDVLNMARGLADEDPKRVAKVIKNWVENNA
jgi:flagellar M-ring protein FliF